MKCLICEKECNSVSNHLKSHDITSKDYYDKYLKFKDENICHRNGCKNNTQFRGINEGYAKFCSVKCSSIDESVKKQREETMIKRFGVINPSLNKNIVLERTKKLNERTDEERSLTEEKKKKTYISKYGVDHPMKCEKVIAQSQKTNLERYGNICSAQGIEVKEKIKKTNIERYNYDHPMKNENVKHKLSNTISNKREPLIKDLLIQIYNLTLLNDFQNNGTELCLKCNKCGNIIKQTYFNIYQGPHPCIICYPRHTGKSLQESELFDFLSSLNISDLKRNCRDVIYNQITKRFLELDIFIPSKNIAIEFNGLYWHKDDFSNKNMHLYKSNLCRDKGIQLIHIFEDEWLFKKDIVKFRLKHLLGYNNSKKIYGRDKKLVIKEIGSKIKNEFLKKFHLQGEDKAVIKLGCFYNDELISVMTFNKGSISKGSIATEGVWELNRFCSDYNYHLVGIASKLLSHFKRHYTWKEIFSYADRRWSNGNVYLKLDFNFVKETTPNYWYIKDFRRIHRFNLRKTSDEPKHITEWELRKAQGYDRIWDCGHYKYRMVNS